jgi:hypothetical protein
MKIPSMIITTILLAFGFLALPERAQAVVPPPDGGYPGGNTAEGEDALFSLTAGVANTAIGFHALFSDTTGGGNTATGFEALRTNNGSNNTATGVQALVSNTTGQDNTANGSGALFSNTNGGQNTAVGRQALPSNGTGTQNTAVGWAALFNNITGSGNIALGSFAGFNLTTGDNNIDIGNEGVAAESNTIRIGTPATHTATFIAGISGTPIGGGGSTVRVNANGQLGTTPSSARFKQNIKPMDTASEAIHALKPVTFRYKQELDPEGSPQFGLVAEDVERVNPDLVARDDKGKVYTVRYDAVNAMLLNEFLKEHRTVQEQGVMIAELKKQIATLTATMKEQAAQIQKVSAQVQMSGPATRVVKNDY